MIAVCTKCFAPLSKAAIDEGRERHLLCMDGVRQAIEGLRSGDEPRGGVLRIPSTRGDR